ncbi:STY0301 family protein [Undibacterium sp. Xuan67W]|uniref:STY0301 family protein n=1 Tax=Undibacterium sp. Xuan67W TaxID=3413057 RepID=UPI003BF44673
MNKKTARAFPFFAMVSLLCLIELPLDTCAADSQLICPPTIDASHVNVTNTEGGWTPFVESHLKLTGVGFMQAPPEKLAHLKPVIISKYKKNDTDKWQFEGDYPYGKWLSCSYENSISLSKKIENSYTVCNVTTIIEKKYGNKIFEIGCQ